MNDMDSDVAELFLEISRKKLFNQYWPRLRQCVAPLSVEQLWWRPNPNSNSIGNLILHMNGNLRQWLVASFNDEEDTRDRPAEFAAEGGMIAAELLSQMGDTLGRAVTVLERLTAHDLLLPYKIQGYEVCGLYAVYQAVEHFSLHYGQIIYITKSLTGRDLGFYKELNKTGRPPKRRLFHRG